MRHRLNKKDRVVIAGKGCNHAVYVRGKPKQKWVNYRAKGGDK